MCYPVCGMMHLKESLLLIGKSSPCGGSGFSLSLSQWSFTICLTPYKRKSASLNKTFPYFLPSSLQYQYALPCGPSSRLCCFFHVEKERNDLFNDAINTFLFTVIWCQTCLRTTEIMSEKIRCRHFMGYSSFICTIPQIG